MSPNIDHKAFKDFHFKTSIPIRFADIDMFGHVNNAIYLTYFEIARTVYLAEVLNWDWDSIGIILASVEISYLKPIRLNDEVRAYVKTSNIGKSSFTLNYALVREIRDDEELCTIGKTTCVTFDYRSNIPATLPEETKQKMEKFEGFKL